MSTKTHEKIQFTEAEKRQLQQGQELTDGGLIWRKLGDGTGVWRYDFRIHGRRYKGTIDREKDGVTLSAALVEERRGPRNPHPNRVPEAVEQQILDLCLKQPTYGSQRIANELRLQGVDVSPSGVRGVWLRHDLETRHKRLLRLEAEARDQTHILTEGQIRLLERHSPEFCMRHVETSAPGELLNRTPSTGAPSRASARSMSRWSSTPSVRSPSPRSTPRRCRSRPPTPSTSGSCRSMRPSASPVKAVLTDNGREFSGRLEQHPYQLLLALSGSGTAGSHWSKEVAIDHPEGG